MFYHISACLTLTLFLLSYFGCCFDVLQDIVRLSKEKDYCKSSGYFLNLILFYVKLDILTPVTYFVSVPVLKDLSF